MYSPLKKERKESCFAVYSILIMIYGLILSAFASAMGRRKIYVNREFLLCVYVYTYVYLQQQKDGRFLFCYIDFFSMGDL